MDSNQILEKLLMWTNIVILTLCMEGSNTLAESSNPCLGPTHKSVISMSAEKQLTLHLLDTYKQVGVGGRPVLNGSHATMVRFGLGLVHMDLDEHDKVMTSSMWIKMRWRDEYLQWNPTEWEGVDHVRLNANNIWVPDVMLINTADPTYDMRNRQVVIYHDGNVTWVPHMIFRSSCSLDVTSFPFDKQKCAMWFGSWTHASREIDLDLASGGLDTQTFEADFHKSRLWDIMNHTSERIAPGDPSDYTVLLFSMTIKRRLVFSGYILTLPCIFLAFLTLVVFCLPPERPDRTGLAMSLFASFLFLLLILVETAPPTAASVPKLGIYYCFNMVVIMLAIFLSSVVVNVNKLSYGHSQLPRWIKVAAVDILARILLVNLKKIKCFSKPSHLPLSTLDEPRFLSSELSNGRLINTSCCFKMLSMRPTSDNWQRYPASMSSGSDKLSNTESVLREIQIHVADMHNIMSKWMDKERTKADDTAECIERRKEWSVLANVLDRFFLLVYLIGIIWSLLYLFPWPESDSDS